MGELGLTWGAQKAAMMQAWGEHMEAGGVGSGPLVSPASWAPAEQGGTGAVRGALWASPGKRSGPGQVCWPLRPPRLFH